MRETLQKFKKMEIDKKTLYKEAGCDLYNMDCEDVIVRTSDVWNAIKCVLSGKNSIQDLIDWTNIVWFRDVFDFPDEECDSIVSVLEVLETLDEDGVTITKDQLQLMQKALKNNVCYKHYF